MEQFRQEPPVHYEYPLMNGAISIRTTCSLRTPPLFNRAISALYLSSLLTPAIMNAGIFKSRGNFALFRWFTTNTALIRAPDKQISSNFRSETGLDMRFSRSEIECNYTVLRRKVA